MRQHDSAIAPVRASFLALGWGLLGVTAFSFTVPMTRIATGGLPPLFVGSARAVVAALLAASALLVTRQHVPTSAQWLRIAVAGGGIVLGFPLLTTYALVSVPAGHAAVVVALLPVATAVTVVLRTRERPPLPFRIVATVSAFGAVGFAVLEADGVGELRAADLMLFAAVVAAAIGYAEGGLLARELGAWQTVSWALLACSPVTLALTSFSLAEAVPSGTATQWAAFGYLGVVSMFLGFVAWYRGLALGPMARISQVQLVQPVLTIAWAALLLREALSPATVAGGLVVVLCAAGAVRVRAAAPTGPALGSTGCVSPSSNSTPPTRRGGSRTG